MLLLQQLLNISHAALKNAGKGITTEKGGRMPVQRRIFPSLSRPVASAQTRPQESSGRLVLGYLVPGQTCTFEKSNDSEHFQSVGPSARVDSRDGDVKGDVLLGFASQGHKRTTKPFILS